jgi:hypothetical protein
LFLMLLFLLGQKVGRSVRAAGVKWILLWDSA